MPLGGRKYQVHSFAFVLLFLALWNNFDSTFLFWVFVNAGLYGVEIITSTTSKHTTPTSVSSINDIVYHMFSAVYTHVLLFVNLLGYTIGPSTLMFIQARWSTWEGLKVCLYSLYFYYWIVKLFHYLGVRT